MKFTERNAAKLSFYFDLNSRLIALSKGNEDNKKTEVYFQ